MFSFRRRATRPSSHSEPRKSQQSLITPKSARPAATPPGGTSTVTAVGSATAGDFAAACTPCGPGECSTRLDPGGRAGAAGAGVVVAVVVGSGAVER